MMKSNTYGFIKDDNDFLNNKKIISKHCSSKNILIDIHSYSLYLKLDYMDENDTLVLISLKHVANTSNELISFFHKVTKNGIRLVVLEEEIDMPSNVSSLFADYFETFKRLLLIILHRKELEEEMAVDQKLLIILRKSIRLKKHINYIKRIIQ